MFVLVQEYVLGYFFFSRIWKDKRKCEYLSAIPMFYVYFEHM